MSKKIKLIAVGAIALVIVLAVWPGTNNSDELVVSDFSIKKGENVWDVANDLKANKLIDSSIKFVFNIYKNGLQKEIKAGDYKLSSDLSNSDIAKIITEGRVVEESESIKITFPEGWSSGQMAERLSENGFSGENFLELVEKPNYFYQTYGFEFLKNIPEGQNMEGFLFPDTYFLKQDTEAEIIIKKMLDNFDEKLSTELREEISSQGKTVYEVITMASLIEKEVRIEEDRKIVGGVFWNRLEIGQALQSCATLAFIRGDNKMQYSYADTKIDSLYNTYLYPGLPPGPIANPGLSSIEAAIYPTETDYIYFLNNPETGETVFSRTLEEHNVNKFKNGL